jgi:CTP:molybdopterin cytidylyltransferase MocA
VTVAAVVLAPDHDDAHAEVGGVAAIRRIADIAWAGGALPIVVVTRDEAAALDVGGPLSGAAGAIVVPLDQANADADALAAGIAAARDQVDGTDSVLVWPGRYVHVDAETVTSLIEAHGVGRGAVLVPTYDGTPGWPLLVPVEAAASLAGGAGMAGGAVRLGDLAGALRGAGIQTRLIELGDPGTVHDMGTPAADVPEFRGPPEPVAGSAPDWGERVPAVDPSPAPPPGAR